MEIDYRWHYLLKVEIIPGRYLKENGTGAGRKSIIMVLISVDIPEKINQFLSK